MFGNLVAPCNTEIDAALANEGRNVCGGEEDKCDRQVLDQSEVEAVFAAELDIATGEQVKGCLLETALCMAFWLVWAGIALLEGQSFFRRGGMTQAAWMRAQDGTGNLLLGTAKRSLPSRLYNH